MSTQHELPWGKIHKEVDRAIPLCTKTQFVSTRSLAEFIMETPEKYPTTVGTLKCTISRITLSIRRRGWIPFTSDNNGGKSKVFVIPEPLRRKA